MKILSGRIDCKNGWFQTDSTDVLHGENDRYIIDIFGSMTSEDKTLDAESVLAIFEEYGDGIINVTDGIYIAVIYSKSEKILTVYQDRSSSGVAFYYTEKNGMLYYSTSLKKLLQSSQTVRELNRKSIPDFVCNGYIVGENTLVENVFKLKTFNCLKVTKDGAKQIKLDYRVDEISLAEAVENWCPVLDSSIKECATGDSVAQALSSGFDSNYILYVCDRDCNTRINCFSIGGKFGKNELPTVIENAKLFPKVNLKYELTDSETLKFLPDIVQRLEGSVFECGLFLQYELAALVAKNNVPYMICGECADQVMNMHYFEEGRGGDEALPNHFYYDFAEYPSVYAHYVIQKKNGILFNSFGIETKYPFLKRNFLPITKALGRINRKDKRFHVATCEKLLKPEIIKNTTKIGGSTDVHSLFESKDEIRKFTDAVKSNKLYKEFAGCANYGNIAPSNESGFREKFRKTALTVMGRKPQKDYYWEEIELRELLCYAYLIIFNKQFIDGDLTCTSSEGNLFEMLK